MKKMSRKYEIDDQPLLDLEGWRLNLQRELNQSQYNFATSEASAIMGLAGPGSGKTRALVYRTANLINRGVPPRHILLVTFTNKAAEVMKSRLTGILGRYPHDLWAGTFHSIGARILRSYASRFERSGQFTILDEDDRTVILRGVLDDIKKNLTPEEQKLFVKRGFAGKLISQARNSGKTITAILKKYYSKLAEYTELLQRLADRYEQRKIDTNSFDFDDLLVKWLELLNTHDEARTRYQEQFHHVLVDEFQDTNIIQGRLIDLMAEKSNVCVVGDDAQSIYAFRFAEIDNIIMFPSRHPNCQVIRMEENYRSSPEIVELINEIISVNKDQFPKRLVSQKEGGERPWVIKAWDVYEEAAFVAQRIQELYHQGLSLNRMAVLYRSSYLSQDLELEIIRRHIPYRTYGGLKLMQKAHIKDVLAWMRILYNPYDESSWRRIIPLYPGLGKVTCSRLVDEILELEDPLQAIVSGELYPPRGKQGWETISNTLEAIIDEREIAELIYLILQNGYYELLQKNFPDSWEDRYQSLERLAAYSEKYDKLEQFLESLSLEETLFYEDGGAIAQEHDFLTFSTIHSAKGKEWDAVFVLGVNEGHFPSTWGDAKLEEERRLFYVATSRAARFLHISTYSRDYRQGASFATGPSIFLRELSPKRYELIHLK